MNFANTADLHSILIQTWIDLGHGVLRHSHPYHTPALATSGDAGPDQRTVVLRHADFSLRSLVCHTDHRSPKVSQVLSHDAVSWLFYDSANKIQLRLLGRARIHHQDEVAAERWRLSAQRSRSCYFAAEAPGASRPAPRAPAPLDTGFENFAVIDCRVSRIDWLFLQHQGHLRARYEWIDGAWRSQWIAP